MDEEVMTAEAEETTVETPEGEIPETVPPEKQEEQEPTCAESAENPSDEEGAVQPEPQKITVYVDGEEQESTTEELARYAEDSRRFGELQPVLDRLQYLSAFVDKPVTDLLESLIESSEKAEYAKILEECGNNEATAKRLFDYQKNERQTKYEKAKSSSTEQAEEKKEAKRKALDQRLAEEFIELSKEEPEKFSSVKDVPQAVVDMAVKKKISLLDAYLRHERAENRKISEAKAKQDDAKSKSAGPMSGNPERPAPELDAFLQGIHQALR